ncbi:hypothetical protein JK358_35975 [Nocardia sp. 2]|uniref:Uncharacterized protein n=1 Tax=Nocardia acididurans TaxID=2802282 RepID=A0ABS1MID2_9NOCA|nr:hypothetical protein [Nocardia acididurans]MBL1079815.1 hypothetical protein [Nocardia acididurans]
MSIGPLSMVAGTTPVAVVGGLIYLLSVLAPLASTDVRSLGRVATTSTGIGVVKNIQVASRRAGE